MFSLIVVPFISTLSEPSALSWHLTDMRKKDITDAVTGPKSKSAIDRLSQSYHSALEAVTEKPKAGATSAAEQMRDRPRLEVRGADEGRRASFLKTLPLLPLPSSLAFLWYEIPSSRQVCPMYHRVVQFEVLAEKSDATNNTAGDAARRLGISANIDRTLCWPPHKGQISIAAVDEVSLPRQ
jgi:hypothetical protein